MLFIFILNNIQICDIIFMKYIYNFIYYYIIIIIIIKNILL